MEGSCYLREATSATNLLECEIPLILTLGVRSGISAGSVLKSRYRCASAITPAAGARGIPGAATATATATDAAAAKEKYR